MRELFQTTKNKVIALLLLTNAVFIAFVVGTVPLLLFLSGLLNIGLVYVIRKFAKEKEDLYVDMDKIMDTADLFGEHLAHLYQIETYHGEPVIEELIRHSYEVVNEIADIQDKYGFAVLSEELEVVHDEGSEEENSE